MHKRAWTRERTHKPNTILRSWQSQIGVSTDQQRDQRIKRNDNNEEENHYTIKEGQRGWGWGCRLKTKVDGSSDGKSSERGYTSKLQREVLFFWECSQGQRWRAREGELDQIEDSLPSPRLETWRRGGIESWCDGNGGNPGMGHKVIRVTSMWWQTELKTERKKGSIGDTEDLPGAAFLTNRGCVSVHRLGKHQQNSFFREASLYGFWSLLKSVKTKKVISVLLMKGHVS